jgi:hypothetical protein
MTIRDLLDQSDQDITAADRANAAGNLEETARLLDRSDRRRREAADTLARRRETDAPQDREAFAMARSLVFDNLAKNELRPHRSTFYPMAAILAGRAGIEYDAARLLIDAAADAIENERIQAIADGIAKENDSDLSWLADEYPEG